MNFPAARGLRKEEIARLVVELEELISGQRVGKIFDGPGGNLRIVIGSGSRRHHLLVSLHPGTSRMMLWETPPAAPPRPSDLVEKMRDLISGARIDKVDQPGKDRVMRLTLYPRGSQKSRELIVELFGRQGRLLITEGRNRRILLVTGRAGVARGDLYLPPQIPKAAQSGSDGTGSATLPFDPIQVIPVEDREGEAPLHRWLAPRLEKQEQARLLVGLLHGHEQKLRRIRKTYARRLQKLETDLDVSHNWEQWQRKGELLKGNLSALKRGMASVEVPDWYQEGTPLVEIALETDRTPQENVERCFRRARKGKRSIGILTRRKSDTVDVLETIDQIIAAVPELEDVSSSSDERVQQWCQKAQELIRLHGKVRGGVGLKQGSAAKGKKEAVARFRTFRSREGLTILAGRNARENDELSIRTARGNDLFFHVAGRPGAHVILRVERGKVAAPESIDDAAFVAARLSGWRGPETLIVHWTEAKNVRKPKGLPPGKVLIDRHREHLVMTREDGMNALLPPGEKDSSD